MSNPTMNSFLDIFAAPNNVFDRIRDKTLSAWLPLVIILVATIAVFGWYFMTVDMFQFMETSMQMSGQTPTNEELDAVMQGESVIRIISVASAGIGSLVVYLILALFFFLAATLIAEEKFSYGQFLSIVSWGSLPGLITILSAAITYALANDFIYVTSLDMTSLASLLGMQMDAPNYDVASGLSLGSIWTYVLYGMGFIRLTRCSISTGVIVAIIPPALQYGLTYFL
ncbi:MAG: YIP1 family protein [Reinekea sp.]|nr:YIP1 family protein [Reinekea sp.]